MANFYCVNTPTMVDFKLSTRVAEGRVGNRDAHLVLWHLCELALAQP